MPSRFVEVAHVSTAAGDVVPALAALRQHIAGFSDSALLALQRTQRALEEAAPAAWAFAQTASSSGDTPNATTGAEHVPRPDATASHGGASRCVYFLCGLALFLVREVCVLLAVRRELRTHGQRSRRPMRPTETPARGERGTPRKDI